MALFGEDSRDRHIAFLEKRVEFLEEQLTMIADKTAAARLVPRPERKPPTGPTKTHHRFLEDRPDVTPTQAASDGHKAAVAAEASFNDPRQP